MTVETLVGYIKEGKKKGFTLEQLHKSLLEQGYNIEEIQNAVIITENAPTLTEEHGINMEKPLIKKSHNPLVFVIGIVLILILAGALIVLNLDKTSSEETSEQTKEDMPPDIIETEDNNDRENMPPEITETSSNESETKEMPPDLETDSQEFDDGTIEEDVEEIPEE